MHHHPCCLLRFNKKRRTSAMIYGRYSQKLTEPRTIRVTSENILSIVSLDEAKQHMRVEYTDDDTYIEGLIEAAEKYCETVTGRTYLTKQLEATFDGFFPEIRLPRPPIYRSAPNVTIFYMDGTQTQTSVPSQDYKIEYSEPAILRPAYSKTWPTALADTDSVRVSWQAGYGTARSDVPQGVRHAALMMIGHLYERRLAYDTMNSIEVPLGVKELLSANSWGQYR